MKLNYNDIQYIIEITSRILSNEGRMAMAPSNKKDEYEIYYVKNSNDKQGGKKYEPPRLVYNDVVYEIYDSNNINYEFPSNSVVRTAVTNKLYITKRNPKEMVAQNWGRIINTMQQDTSYAGNNPLTYLIGLLNNPLRCIYTQETQIGQHVVPSKKTYPLANACGLSEKELISIDNLNINFNVKEYNKEYYSARKATDTWINSYDEENDSLLVDILEMEKQQQQQLMAWKKQGKTDGTPIYKDFVGVLDVELIDANGNERTVSVPYYNISNFSVHVASYLKKGKTGSINNRFYKGPDSGLKINSGNPNQHNVDISALNDVNKTGTEVNNQSLNFNDDGTVTGKKIGDEVYSGDMLAIESAKCMAHLIKNRVGNNIGAMLSVESSSDYNQRAIGSTTDENGNSVAPNSAENILYQLQNTFGQNVSHIYTNASFFKKCAYMFEVVNTKKIDKGRLENMFFRQLIQCIKYAFEHDDERTLDVLQYCNANEDPELLDDELGVADFSFLRNPNYQLGEDRKLRTWKGNTVQYIYEDLFGNDKWIEAKFNQNAYAKDEETGQFIKDENGNKIMTGINSVFQKWEIKSLNETERKYIKGFLTCAVDGTIEQLKRLKNSVKIEGGANKRNRINNDAEQYRKAEDGDSRSIIIVDDNFSTGSTLKEAVRALIGYININPRRIFCLTPGVMSAQGDDQKQKKKIK